jgi:hypothetical protein
MDSTRHAAQEPERPASGRARFGHFRRARVERPHADHGTPRRPRHLSDKTRRYLWFTAAAVGIYLASLLYAHLEQASHAAVQATHQGR